jgi:superfamily I DNA/RNA helicase
LGADVVFLIGFDQGRFPTKEDASEAEIYQMLVAVTRAKKRLYLINTVGRAISIFTHHIEASDLDVEEIKPRSAAAT